MSALFWLLARWRIVLPTGAVAAVIAWAWVAGIRAERAHARATAAEAQLEAFRAADAAEAQINAAEATKTRSEVVGLWGTDRARPLTCAEKHSDAIVAVDAVNGAK